VIDFDDPPLQACIMMSNSMMLSLILSGQPIPQRGGKHAYWLLPLCTMKTSWSRTLVWTSTRVSPLPEARSAAL